MDQEPETPSDFEGFLADLSTRLTDLTVERLDAGVLRCLRELGEFLGTDTATLGEFSPDATRIDPVSSWTRPPREPYTNPVPREDFPWVYDQVVSGRTVRLRGPEDLPDHATRDREYALRTGVKSNLMVPIAVGDRYLCVISTTMYRAQRSWSDAAVVRLRTVGQMLAGAIYRRRAEAELRARLVRIERLQERLHAENAYFRQEIEHLHGFDEIVGRSAALRTVLERATQVAATDSTVLLLGETGTGKDLLARAIHDRSPRRARPLVSVNCAALPAPLIESELFGHEKGAFTGATARKLGRFELADGGTLFLDEIGELPVELQPKLLRVLQDGTFERVGGTRTHRVDVRIIAATNRDLVRAIAEGRFREDLYYRLSVFPIFAPALRERREDISLLVWAIIERKQAKLGRHIDRVPKRVMDAFVSYSWPGNVRELENVVERALILSTGAALHLEEPLAAARPAVAGDSLDQAARAHILYVLERCAWQINGPGHAAELLGLHPSTLRFRMRRLGIKRGSSQPGK
jgi:formate hydrogenlyase transcriptional activator